MAPRLTDYTSFIKDLVSGRRLRMELTIADARDLTIGRYLDLSKPQRILDLGSGRLRPQYAILKTKGHFVAGVDLINRPVRDIQSLAYRVARRLFRLRMPGAVSAENEATLVCADAAALPFEDGSFDYATSVAAFEHFLDIPAVIDELWRVLRPGGFAFVGFHPFTSLSGGHNVQLMGLPIERLPEGVEAWDHLRQRKVPFHVPLNEWRIARYLAEFTRYFDIVENYCAEREGVELLTEELAEALSEYTEDELTCKGYNVIGRRRETAG